jgi:hypothetical protein
MPQLLLFAAARIGLTHSPSESDMHNPLHQAAIYFSKNRTNKKAPKNFSWGLGF